MAQTFADCGAALAWLYSTQRLGVKLGLENMRLLLARLGLPDAGCRFIHAAGTNGKGSTCAFLHALLERAQSGGTGLFTSPHLTRFNERICDGQREIADDELAVLLTELREVAEAFEAHPTFFELALALALRWFQRRGLRWAVIETGLGGRLDATNALVPAVTVITRIGLDHMELLGDSLAKIAKEKAGIIKPGVPVVTVPQAEEAMAVLRRVAAARGAPLTVVSEPWTRSQPGLAGAHQRWNAALAVAAVRAAGFVLDESAIVEALAATRWPGRFERLQPDLVLDGAHNEDGAAALAKTWRETFGQQRAALVFGAVREKALEAVLRRLAPLAARWHLTGFQSPRALPPEEIRERLRALSPAVDATCHASVAAALAAARAGRDPVLICGSLFLIGEARALLLRDRFERSAQ